MPDEDAREIRKLPDRKYDNGKIASQGGEEAIRDLTPTCLEAGPAWSPSIERSAGPALRDA